MRAPSTDAAPALAPGPIERSELFVADFADRRAASRTRGFRRAKPQLRQSLLRAREAAAALAERELRTLPGCISTQFAQPSRDAAQRSVLPGLIAPRRRT
jgi:hypothetical protein